MLVRTPDRLRRQLRGISVEQAPYRTRHAVQAVAVCPVSEQTDRENAECAADAVHGDSADRIVDFQRLLDEEHRQDDENPRQAADDDG